MVGRVRQSPGVPEPALFFLLAWYVARLPDPDLGLDCMEWYGIGLEWVRPRPPPVYTDSLTSHYFPGLLVLVSTCVWFF